MNEAEEFRRRLEAAQSGSVEDMLFVGWAFLHGSGIPQSVPEALAWWEKARAMGSVEATVRLAEIYETGEVVTRSCTRAIALYEEALRDSSIFGPYVYGVAHYYGSSCVPQDLAKAGHYFKIAAERGHFVSAFIVARLYRTGQFGLGPALWGCLLPIVTLCKALPSLVRPSGHYEAWWDSHRWLGDRGVFGKIKAGARFD